MTWPIVFTVHGVILEYYSACASKQISQVSQKKLREKSDDVSTTMQYLIVLIMNFMMIGCRFSYFPEEDKGQGILLLLLYSYYIKLLYCSDL